MFRSQLIVVVAGVVVALGAGVAEAKSSLVEVDARGAQGAMRLERLGLDVVHIGADAVEVQLHGAQDERRLDASATARSTRSTRSCAGSRPNIRAA